MSPEDRTEYEQILDHALRSARLTTHADTDRIEALRGLAVDALPQITAAAAPEYERLVRLRLQPRTEGRASGPASGPASASGRPDGPGGGSGVITVFFALVPVLAAIAAVVFLLLGYALRVADPEPAMAAPMRSAGWVFAVIAAAGLLVAVGGLVVAAVRNGATSIRATATGQDQLARAREEWRRALLERGIAPFLREHAAGADHERQGRSPRLRFSSPDFSSPEFSSRGGGASAAPRYGRTEFSSPDFSSPDFSSPADDDQDAAQPEFSSPDFSSPADGGDGARPRFGHPDFSGPTFTSPAEGGADRD
ncbi:hypothetical protein [Streptomyces johnsoniae]|uniref:Transmembrane protein n=1 Tax=Streptomyces johnsoniae TaxID=3075532 RepID=A0ABU2SAB8_9ACTN|nr:hypothetical protein [Streptomyces sp. DSM 41886]MDT0445917.1 hypothetical protein [Streptomyces sp. DSM 41886]